jgi:hypothetical protein
MDRVSRFLGQQYCPPMGGVDISRKTPPHPQGLPQAEATHKLPGVEETKNGKCVPFGGLANGRHSDWTPGGPRLECQL